MSMRNSFLKALGTTSLAMWMAVSALSGASVSTASAGSLGATPPVAVSSMAASPLAGCAADNVAAQQATNIPNSEVEPFVAVNPTNPVNIVGVWQQDRWGGTGPAGGGARGNVVGVSFDGGATWSVVSATKSSLCTGGTAENGGDYQRATDPWLSFAPNGDLYLMSLSLNSLTGRGAFGPSAMLVSKSTDGGLSWSAPTTLIRDDNPNIENDKNSFTADPNDPSFAYAVWHRVVVASENTSPVGGENVLISSTLVGAAGYRAATWFARTTDKGATWEPARPINDLGEGAEPFGEQIVVLPDISRFDGELVMLLNAAYERKNAQDVQGANLAIMRSQDKGAHWSAPIIFDKLSALATIDPLTGQPVRNGRFIPNIAVDPTSGALYAVWHDGRFSGFQYNDIAFSMSADGGLSWTVPVKVNLTPPVSPTKNRQAFTPTVHVAADGTVGVSYYDFRNNGADATASEPLETDLFLAHCHAPTTAAANRCADSGGWSETRVTPGSFDMRKAPISRGLFLGDYMGLANAGNRFIALFPQANSSADPSTMYYSAIP